MLFRIFPIDDHQTRSCSSGAPETRSLTTTAFSLKTIETEQRGGGEGIKRTLVMWAKTTFPQNRIVHASGGNFSRFSRVITCPRLRQPEDPSRGVPIFFPFLFLADKIFRRAARRALRRGPSDNAGASYIHRHSAPNSHFPVAFSHFSEVLRDLE